MATPHHIDSAHELEKQVSGSVLVPDASGYDGARRGFNLGIDQHPALILVAANADDIAAGVRFAREQGLGVSVQLTGHGIQHPADNSLLIVTSNLTGVQVDAEARTVRVEAGVRFRDVFEKVAQYGLAPLSGTSPHVGVVGYTLGGGVGWLGRRYGFAADSVRWMDIVTPDGVLRRASLSENADLFKGLRGGGGNFGVVTAMEFDLYPVSSLYGGGLTYTAERAGEALRFFRDHAAKLPDTMTASIAILKFPNIPQMPEAIRGKTQIVVRAACLSDAATGEYLIKPWLDWQTPLNNTFHQMPFKDIGTIQNDPVDPVDSFASCEMFRDLSDAALDIIVRRATAADSPLLYSELRQSGGAMAREAGSYGVTGNRDANFYFLIGGMTPNPQAREAVEAYVAQLKAELKPYVTGGVYLNFMRGKEAQARIRDAYTPDDYDHLRALKASYDPDNLFRYSYQIVG